MKIISTILLTLLFYTNYCQIPESVQHFLLNQEVELVSKSKLIDDWTSFLSTECPTMTMGDFNGDGLDDYAFLATSKRPTTPYRLVVVQSNKELFELINIMDIGFGIYIGGLGFGMEKFPKKKVKGINNRVDLKHDGIFHEI